MIGPYDIEKARLIKENARLKRLLQTPQLPEGAGYCEDCEYPSMVNGLENKITNERRKYNSTIHQMESNYRELSWDLDDCRNKAHKCKIENRKLKAEMF